MAYLALVRIVRIENITSMGASGSECRGAATGSCCDIILEGNGLIWAWISWCWSEDIQLADVKSLRVPFASRRIP